MLHHPENWRATVTAKIAQTVRSGQIVCVPANSIRSPFFNATGSARIGDPLSMGFRAFNMVDHKALLSPRDRRYCNTRFADRRNNFVKGTSRPDAAPERTLMAAWKDPIPSESPPFIAGQLPGGRV
jgi:hypothetical protein